MKFERMIFFIALFLFALFFLPSCSVSPVTVNVFGVSIPEGNVTIEQGQTEQLSASIVPADATNKTVIWESDHPEIVTVSEYGLVTGLVVGKANITVMTIDGGYTDTVEVNVVPETVKVTGVTILGGDQTLFLGNTKQLIAVVEPADATNKTVIWESGFTDVATVDQNGLVTAVVVGEADIIVTTEDGGFTDTVKITVKQATIL
jgi:uncharacterized protein YjdB